MAPFQRAAQCLVPGHAVRSATERGQGIAEPLHDLGGFENGRPGRRQLQGQGHPIQPSAQVNYSPYVVGVEREVWPDLRCSLDEEPDGGQAGPTRRGRGHRRERAAAGPMTGPGRCTPRGHGAVPGWWRARRPRGIRRAERRPVGRRQRAGARNCPARSAVSVRAAGRQALSPGLGAVTGVQPKRLRHCVGHQQRLADSREIDEPHSVGVRRTGSPRRLQRQPGLAAAAGSGKGEQSSPVRSVARCRRALAPAR